MAKVEGVLPKPVPTANHRGFTHVSLSSHEEIEHGGIYRCKSNAETNKPSDMFVVFIDDCDDMVCIDANDEWWSPDFFNDCSISKIGHTSEFDDNPDVGSMCDEHEGSKTLAKYM